VAHLAFVFCCLVWGSTFILLERVSHVFGPVEIGIWRMLSGAAAVAAVGWYVGASFRLPRRDWVAVLVVGLVFTAPSQVFQAYLLAHGMNHSLLGSMVAAIPLLTILISVPMLGEKPTTRELVGVLGGLACIGLLVEEGAHQGMSAGMMGLIFLVPLSATLSNTYIKWKLSHVPAAPLTTALLVVASVALLPVQLYPSALQQAPVTGTAAASVTPLAVSYLLILGVVGSGISTMVFVWMVLEKGPLFAGMTTYVVPLLALAWGGIDAEPISTQQLVAIGAILFMVAIVQSGSRRDVEIVCDAESPLRLLTAEEAVAELAPELKVNAMTQSAITPESLAS
jgi:drug/metabolite transporter (DMT)-like permease